MSRPVGRGRRAPRGAANGRGPFARKGLPARAIQKMNSKNGAQKCCAIVRTINIYVRGGYGVGRTGAETRPICPRTETPGGRLRLKHLPCVAMRGGGRGKLDHTPRY